MVASPASARVLPIPVSFRAGNKRRSTYILSSARGRVLMQRKGRKVGKAGKIGKKGETGCLACRGGNTRVGVRTPRNVMQSIFRAEAVPMCVRAPRNAIYFPGM